jgi:hypothetical protein
MLQHVRLSLYVSIRIDAALFQRLLLEHHDVKLAIKSPQNHLLVHHQSARYCISTHFQLKSFWVEKRINLKKVHQNFRL